MAATRRDMRDALALYGYVLLSSGQTDRAHAVFRGLHALFPDDTHAAKCLAVTSLRTGDALAALALADSARVSASDDDRQTLDFVRGKALFALGRGDEARAVLEGVLGRHAAAMAPAPPSTGATR